MGFCYVIPSLHVSCVYRKKDSRILLLSVMLLLVLRLLLLCHGSTFCTAHNCTVRYVYSAAPVPNVAVEWAAFLNPVQEIFGSNHGQETGYPDRGISTFSSASVSKCRDAPQIRLCPLPSICLPVH